MKRIAILLLYISCVLITPSIAQENNAVLILKMENYEKDIQKTYNEYQKVYYERKSSKNELQAFEDIISVYVTQILEIYETLQLSLVDDITKPRDIAARALILRSLTFLEKAPLNNEFYEKACYDYYTALEMYQNVDEIPVILKPLPQPIFVGAVKYDRLIDLIDVKGKDLFSFGKIKIKLRNFKITSNLNAEAFVFERFFTESKNSKFTYLKSESLIKHAFKNVLYNQEETEFFLALPEGSYRIKSSTKYNPFYPSLSSIYVRPNQQHEYIIEPLVDWIVIYENPQSKQPDVKKLSSNASSSIDNFDSQGNSKDIVFDKRRKSRKNILFSDILIDNIKGHIEDINADQIFNIRDTWIQSKFVNLTAEKISSAIAAGKYYNSWSNWMLSMDIAHEVTEEFSPGTMVPTELIRLVYLVLKDF